VAEVGVVSRGLGWGGWGFEDSVDGANGRDDWTWISMQDSIFAFHGFVAACCNFETSLKLDRRTLNCSSTTSD